VPSSTRLSILRVLCALAAPFTQVPAHAQDLVVIVNPSVGVQQLTRRQTIDIFLGRYRTFPSGVSAMPIDLDITSTERTQFYLLLAHKDAAGMTTWWLRASYSGQISPPFPVHDARAAVDIVANNRFAIAYVDRAAVDDRVRIALEITQ
jgi:ABC-type phosphate transport system substrate-binding protein